MPIFASLVFDKMPLRFFGGLMLNTANVLIGMQLLRMAGNDAIDSVLKERVVHGIFPEGLGFFAKAFGSSLERKTMKLMVMLVDDDCQVGWYVPLLILKDDGTAIDPIKLFLRPGMWMFKVQWICCAFAKFLLMMFMLKSAG